MMTLHFTPSDVSFRLGDTVAGLYRFTDEFKPHIHPLRTPRGHALTSASPHDHKHHKALMYALRAEDVNFWEEFPTLETEVPGVQKHLGFSDIISRAPRIGFTETLRWAAQDGSLASFEEERTISCRFDVATKAFIWTWQTHLTALRPLHLIQSQWSHGLPDGSKVNYHGLGLRFRRDFGGMTRGNELHVDGEVFKEKFQQQMGARPKQVTFIGSLDETWPVERAGVTFRQADGQDNTLYIMEDYIPFMGLGPTNRAPLHLAAGQQIKENYEISVFDV
jgi:hypothetical protein